MCTANINTTTQPCQHRWAHLVQPCAPHRDLQTCPSKLQFAGWEQKHAACPWCAPTSPAQSATHRLFGGAACPIAPVAEAGDPHPLRRQRTGSTGTASTTLSRHSSVASSSASTADDDDEEARQGSRHRDQEARLRVYLTCAPHEVLPSRGRWYPTYGGGGEEGEGRGEQGRRESGFGGMGAGGRWRKGLRLGRGVFKG